MQKKNQASEMHDKMTSSRGQREGGRRASVAHDNNPLGHGSVLGRMQAGTAINFTARAFQNG